jgi:hypothetical protein
MLPFPLLVKRIAAPILALTFAFRPDGPARVVPMRAMRRRLPTRTMQRVSGAADVRTTQQTERGSN